MFMSNVNNAILYLLKHTIRGGFRMKKQIYKNIFLIVFSGILLMTIMLIAKETDLFDDLEDLEAGLKRSG